MYNDYLETVVSHRRQQQTLIHNFPGTDATAAVLLKKTHLYHNNITEKHIIKTPTSTRSDFLYPTMYIRTAARQVQSSCVRLCTNDLHNRCCNDKIYVFQWREAVVTSFDITPN